VGTKELPVPFLRKLPRRISQNLSHGFAREPFPILWHPHLRMGAVRKEGAARQPDAERAFGGQT